MPKPKSKVKRIVPYAVAMALALMTFPAYAAPIINAQPATSCDATGFCKTTAELAGVLTASQINNLKSANITQFVSKLRSVNVTDVNYYWNGTALTVTGRIRPQTSNYWLLDMGTVKVDPWWNYSWAYGRNFTINETLGSARTQGGAELWFNGTDGRSNCTDTRIVEALSNLEQNRTIINYQLSGNSYNCSIHMDINISANENKTYTLLYNASVPDTALLAVTYDDFRSNTSANYQSADIGATSNNTFAVNDGALDVSCSGSCSNLWSWNKKWIQQGNITFTAQMWKHAGSTNDGIGMYQASNAAMLAWSHQAHQLQIYTWTGSYDEIAFQDESTCFDKWCYIKGVRNDTHYAVTLGSTTLTPATAVAKGGYPSMVTNGATYIYHFDNLSITSNGLVVSGLGGEVAAPTFATNITILFNGTDGNYSGSNSSVVNITAFGNTTVPLTLQVNGTSVNTTYNPITNITTFTVGYYNITAFWAGNASHPFASATAWANITYTAPVPVVAPVDTVVCFTTRPVCVDTMTNRVFLEGNPL